MTTSFLKVPGSHTQRRTTVGRTSLDEWSPHRRDLLPDSTQHSQETGIHAAGGIRTRNPRKRAAAYPRVGSAATGIGINRDNQLMFYPRRFDHTRPIPYIIIAEITTVCIKEHHSPSTGHEVSCPLTPATCIWQRWVTPNMISITG
jgi:hypothetical protein